MATKRKPAITPPKRRRQVVPMFATRREIPRGQIWCGTCKGLASEEGSVRTKHGFTFCREHR